MSIETAFGGKGGWGMQLCISWPGKCEFMGGGAVVWHKSVRREGFTVPH